MENVHAFLAAGSGLCLLFRTFFVKNLRYFASSCDLELGPSLQPSVGLNEIEKQLTENGAGAHRHQACKVSNALVRFFGNLAEMAMTTNRHMLQQRRLHAPQLFGTDHRSPSF